jgi:hypothetical protein
MKNPADDEVVVVRKYANEMEARVAQLVLEAHGIPCALLRDDAGGMLPAMQLLFPLRLAVHRRYVEEAKLILDDRSGEVRD